MDLKALGYFVAVVETGSFTAAAERCYVAQPSISHAVSKLESELQLTLLMREKRGVTATPEGIEFYREAKGLLSHAQTVRTHFINKVESPLLTVAVSQSVAFAYLNELLKALKGINPALQVKLIQQSESVDIRLTVDRLVLSEELFIPLWQDHYCLIIPLQSPLAYKECLAVADLNGQAFIERTYCDRNSEWAEFLKLHQIDVTVAAAVDNEEWALSLVEAGVGVSVVPLHQAQDYSNRFVVRELGDIDGLESIRRSVGVAIPYRNLSNTQVLDVKDKIAEFCQSF